MQLDIEKIKKICRDKDLTLKSLLKKAGVSKTAYYNLATKPLVIPKSISKLALALNVSPDEILREVSAEELKVRLLQEKLEEILARDPSINRDNAWHTLLLLQEEPIERLERSLCRGRYNM